MTITKFSFDEWATLYEVNPEEFERRRTELLTAEITKAPIQDRARLRVLQMECDSIRQSMPPIEAAAEITKMAVNKLQELKTPLTQLRAACEDIIHPE